jgi:hypothetical protein
MLVDEWCASVALQASSDGVNENLLLLLHGCGDSPAPFASE